MKRSLSRLVVGGLFCILSFQVGFFAFAASSPVLCCKCSAPGDSSDICLTGSADTCANLLSNSKNPNVAGFSCPTTLEAANCRTVADGGVCTTAGSVATYSKPIQLPPPASQPPLLTPKPGVAIPGLTFSSIAQVTGGKIAIPFIAQYIAAMYNYLIGATLIVAALMLVYGGFLYVLGATVGDIRRSKEIIFNSLVGLILVFSAFTLLKTVSPPAASLKPLDVMVVKKDLLADWLSQNGTTNPDAPLPNPQDLVQQGGITSGDSVDVSGITYDSSEGACQNIGKYCSGPSAAKSATTYEQKQKLLAKSVLGFNKVCISNQRCGYTQASVTSIPSGKIPPGNPAPNFAGKSLISKAGMTPETIWPNNPECVEAWNKDSSDGKDAVVAIPSCRGPAKDLYNKLINNRIPDAKIFASDCVSFVMSAYECAGAPKVYWGNELNSAVQSMLKHKVPTKFMEHPQLILFTNLGDPDIESKVAQKGGVKFGDVFYVTGAVHYYLYTGGRSDVPFTFIEMGGSGPAVNVPGVGNLGGMNIKTVSWQQDIKNKFTTRMDYPKSCPQAGCNTGGQRGSPCKKTCTDKDMVSVPARLKASDLIMIWRPYADATSNAPLTTQPPPPAS